MTSTDKGKVVVIDAEKGKVVGVKVLNSHLLDVVKREVKELVDLWDPRSSDFVVIRENYELLAEEEKTSSRAKRPSAIPVYVVSYDNEWSGDDYLDKRVRVIAPYVNDEVSDEMERWACEITREETGIVIELSEEELESLEE